MPQICEDTPEELDLDVPGLAERPINVFLPRLFQVNDAFLIAKIEKIHFSFFLFI